MALGLVDGLYSLLCFVASMFVPHLAAQAPGCARQLSWNSWQLLQEVMEWLQIRNLVAL
jgi:hypothetical protein